MTAKKVDHDAGRVIVYLKDSDGKVVYTAHFSHAFQQIAKDVGIYDLIWRPNTVDVHKASQLASALKQWPFRDLVKKSRDNKVARQLLIQVTMYLVICYGHPDAAVKVVKASDVEEWFIDQWSCGYVVCDCQRTVSSRPLHRAYINPADGYLQVDNRESGHVVNVPPAVIKRLVEWARLEKVEGWVEASDAEGVEP
jgi:hypothetical protein